MFDNLENVKELSEEEELRLFHLARSGDTEARRVLIESVLKLAIVIARPFFRGNIDAEDLVQVAALEVIDAVDRSWNPEKGRLKTAIKQKIKWACVDYKKQHQHCMRIPQHAYQTMSERWGWLTHNLIRNGSTQLDKYDAPVESDYDPDLREHLDNELNKLSPNFSHAVRLRYYHDMTYGQIADEIGLLSDDGAKKRVVRGIKQLRKQLA